MPAKPFSLGELHFAKKGDAVAYLNAMLHKYDVGDKVSAEDSKVLIAALARHPEGDEKIGLGRKPGERPSRKPASKAQPKKTSAPRKTSRKGKRGAKPAKR